MSHGLMSRFTSNTLIAVLADLVERLARTRFPEQPQNSGWDYGADLSYLNELCNYWRDTYD